MTQPTDRKALLNELIGEELRLELKSLNLTKDELYDLLVGHQTDYKQKFLLCMGQIRLLNWELLNPCQMAWGKMTEEEAEDSFMEGGKFYDDWGDKSMNMLMMIRDME